jgi:nitrate/nitrite transporter NarK
MRKWLILLLALAVVYALSKLNTKTRRKKYPILKRFDTALNIVVWVMALAYLAAFIYWLVTEVF